MQSIDLTLVDIARELLLTTLMVAGPVLVALSLASLAFIGGSPIDQKYIPPQYIDGVIVPSRTE